MARDEEDGLPASDDEWRAVLTPEQYHVLREKGTEQPFSGALLHNQESGLYTCAGCGQELFTGDAKYESRTGWPSFFEPVADGCIRYETDTSCGMTRTEVRCGRCDSHLGHVFEDGPVPTGRRFCINSLSLDFETSETDP